MIADYGRMAGPGQNAVMVATVTDIGPASSTVHYFE